MYITGSQWFVCLFLLRDINLVHKSIQKTNCSNYLMQIQRGFRKLVFTDAYKYI